MENKICGWVKQNDLEYVDYHNNEWEKQFRMIMHF